MRISVGRRRSADAVTGLSIVVVLLVLLPSRLIIEPLGAVGTPAAIVSLGCLLWWANARLVARLGVNTERQPVRPALFLFGAAVLASYIAAMTRPISGLEVRAADRGVLITAAWLGIGLVAADGISNLDRLHTLLRRLVNSASVMAALGISQFFTGLNIARYIEIPGLVSSAEYGGVFARDEFDRPAGTSIHPIEFGVVLAMIFPLALYFAFNAPKEQRFRQWLCVALIGVALPMSVSRSAILGVFVVALVMFPSWDPRRRVRAAVVSLCSGLAMWILIPGLLGTIRNLFTTIGNDSSTDSRIDSYSLVAPYILDTPIFGRGFQTFLPQRYRILDNQYLLCLVDSGVVGMLALLIVFWVGFTSVRAGRAKTVQTSQRELGQGLAAGILAGMITFATFDALSFPMAAGVVFLLVGCAGAYWRIMASGGADGLTIEAGPGRAGRGSVFGGMPKG